MQSVQQAGTGRKSETPTVANDVSRHVSEDGPALPIFVQYDHVKVRTLIFSAKPSSRSTHLVRFR